MKTSFLLVLALAVGGCSGFHVHEQLASASDGSIAVDQPEVFENADLQAQLDALRAQLSTVSAVNQTTLAAAVGNVQGTRIEQSGASLQLLGRPLPQIQTTHSSTTGTSPSVTQSEQITQASLAPSNPALPAGSSASAASVAPSAFGLLDQQMQLASQLSGYQLLLTGSDFARYTNGGGPKDRIVIGVPISIMPNANHRDMVAEVKITYFPPNPKQYLNPLKFEDLDPANLVANRVCDDYRFSTGDVAAATTACAEQEAAPTIVNILPSERSYNTVGLTSDANSVSAGAVLGTVSVGGSFGNSLQTQYIVAQQDTVAYQLKRPVICPTPSPSSSDTFACVPGTRGVAFVWQFRPVLGEHFVRAGQRRMFVQLAIPYARRPYPNYGGLVKIQTAWEPYDAKSGTVDATGVLEKPESDSGTLAVYGHPFIGATVSEVKVHDLGAGSVMVNVSGAFLVGASVRIGTTILNATTPGFFSTYGSLQFVSTAQALAQSGAVIVASGGVDTPIVAASICKAADDLGECMPDPPSEQAAKLAVSRIELEPASDGKSLLRVALAKPPEYELYDYHRYYRSGSQDVIGERDVRKPAKPRLPLDQEARRRINELPLLLSVGGKIYGFSDLPMQRTDHPGSGTELAVIASNDSLNSIPQLKVQRLFGDPEADSDVVGFTPPGSVTLSSASLKMTLDPTTDRAKKDAKAAQRPCGLAKPPENCANGTCQFDLAGAGVEEFDLVGEDPARPGPVARAAVLLPSSPFAHNVRRLFLDACAMQVTLGRRVSSGAGNDVTQFVVLTVPGGPVQPALVVSPPGSGVPQTPIVPNFSLVRAVQRVAQKDGLAFINVGIQKLKDQSVTLTVINADVVSAMDGSGAKITVLPGNQVTIAQDTNITFELRNFKADGVNILAEGKNGSTSTGKLSFSSAFVISPPERMASK